MAIVDQHGLQTEEAECDSEARNDVLNGHDVTTIKNGCRQLKTGKQSQMASTLKWYDLDIIFHTGC